MSGLCSERDRWESSSVGAADAYESVLGDSILNAAFLIYAGYYDDNDRDTLSQQWQHACLLPARTELSFAQVISLLYPCFGRDGLSHNYQMMASCDDVARWSLLGLPVGNNALSNAILLEQSPRFPLIIDPVNQAGSFLQARYL